eukprot:s2147_g20.t1
MIVDTACSIECSAMAAVSLGLVFVSSCNEEVAQAILQTLIERQAVENALSGTWPHFFAVGLGLLYLGQQDAAEATLSALDAITHPMGKYAKLTALHLPTLATSCTCRRCCRHAQITWKKQNLSIRPPLCWALP